jgi:hypothetical protein
MSSTIYLKYVTAGSQFINGSGGQVRTFDKSAFTPHPYFNLKTRINDVALIRISPAFQLDTSVTYVALPKAADRTFLHDDENRTVWVTGFGVTKGGYSMKCNVRLRPFYSRWRYWP